MEEGIKIITTVTEKGFNALQDGTGVITKGGIKDVKTGRMLELFQPLIPQLENNPASSMQMKQNNTSINQSFVGLKEFQQMAGAMNNLNSNYASLARSAQLISGLNVLNTAVSLANCGICIAGFQMMKKEIEEVKNSIENLTSIVQYHVLEKSIFEAKNLLMNMQDIIQLCSTLTINPEVYAMTCTLSQCKIFIENIVTDFMNQKILDKLAVDIIFRLTPVFLESVSTYSSRYYYEHKDWPAHYEEWTSFFSEFNEDAFRQQLKIVLYKSFPTLSTETLKKVCDELILSVTAKKEHIEYLKKITPLIEKKEYFSLKEMISESVQNKDFYVIDSKKQTLTHVSQIGA